MDFTAFGIQAAVAIDIGNLVGDIGGELGVFAFHADVHERRIAILLNAQVARQDLQSQFGCDWRLVFVELQAPDPLQIQIANDLRQNRARSHDFLLRHQEERIVAQAAGLAVVERVHIHRIFEHFQLSDGRELLGHHQRISRARHDGQQGDRENDFLAVPNDAPVVEKVKGCGLRFFCHGVIS